MGCEPQSPDLISGENSAEALLTRIRAERAAAPKPRRGRRKAAAPEELPMVAEGKGTYGPQGKKDEPVQS